MSSARTTEHVGDGVADEHDITGCFFINVFYLFVALVPSRKNHSHSFGGDEGCWRCVFRIPRLLRVGA